MQLWKEIFANLLSQESEFRLSDLERKASEYAESECYNALLQIKAVLEDDRLEDTECFAKIEEIVCIFEELGSHAGNRHDFGRSLINSKKGGQPCAVRPFYSLL